MKKTIVLLVALCLCIALCSCATAEAPAERSKISISQASSIATRTILDEIDDYYGSYTYLDLSKTKYAVETVDEKGLSYRVSGSYYIFWNDGKLFTDQWFGVSVNVYTGTVEDFTIVGH